MMTEGCTTLNSLPPGVKQSGGLFDSIKIYLYSEVDFAVGKRRREPAGH